MEDMSLKFIDFIKSNFDPNKVSIEQLKKNVFFVEIDCLTQEENKELSLVISDEEIAFSKIEKQTLFREDQFSNYDEFFQDLEKAKKCLMAIKLSGAYFPKR